MKVTELKNELLKLQISELEEKIEEWRATLLSLRLKSATSHIKDISQFKKLRKNIARGIVILNDKRTVKFFDDLLEFLQQSKKQQDDQEVSYE